MSLSYDLSMSFQKGNTFVFGETPAASKWDQLWRNDDALADGSGLDDGSISPRAINSNAFRNDSGDWKISTRIDGRKEYYRERSITTPSLASGTSGNITLFAAPADVNPYTALWKSLTIYDAAGNTPPQALTYRLQPQNANGGNIIVRFTNPYNSTTGGGTFMAAVLLVV